jgi:hypothetical protein
MENDITGKWNTKYIGVAMFISDKIDIISKLVI